MEMDSSTKCSTFTQRVSAIALLYTIRYPKNVRYYIIRGFCELQTVFSPSLSLMYPELWEKYTSLCNENVSDIERAKIYYSQIKNKNWEYVHAWFDLEFSTLTTNPSNNIIKMSDSEKYVAALFESHYYSKQFFLKKNYFMDNAHRASGVPGVFIHGKYDVICSMKESYDISKLLPRSRLVVVENAGHSYYDPNIAKAMITEMKRFLFRNAINGDLSTPTNIIRKSCKYP